VQISREFDGQQQALDQAGAYLEETGMDLMGYWQIYQYHRADLLQKRGGLVADHPTPVATTWSLSFERVEQQNPAAADLLRLCAFLAADAIPEEMLTKGALHLGAVLGPVVADPFLFTQAIEMLRAVSLLNRDPRTRMLSVHRLVQVVLRNNMGKEATRCWAERAIKMVVATLPAIGYVHQPIWERLLAHALTCAELAWYDNLHMTEAVSLLQWTGMYLDWRSREKAAESLAGSLLEHALVMSAKEYGADCLEIVDSLNRLAFIYKRQDRYEEAESLFLRALAVHKQHLGPEHPDTAESLNLLAGCYLDQNRYEEAESLYQQALTIYERHLGSEHHYTGSIIHNLASLYERQGRDEEAKPLFQRALAIYTQYLGSEDLGAPFFKNVAYLYLRQDMYEEAEIFFQRELTDWEQRAGPEHFSTAVGLQDLIFLYEKLGKYEKAEPLYQRAITIHERVLGPDHPKTTETRNRLIALLHKMGQHEQASQLEIAQAES
jgi:tetratricopeptide (TPR) repeat protein